MKILTLIVSFLDGAWFQEEKRIIITCNDDIPILLKTTLQSLVLTASLKFSTEDNT